MNLQTDRRFRRSDLGLVTFVVTLGIFFALLQYLPKGTGVGARLLSRAPVGDRRSAGLVAGPRRTISP